jgi:hypothetical protein
MAVYTTLAVLAVSAVAAPALSAQDLEGRVVEDSSGNPLASAELKFRKAGMRELAADLETDREGRFRAPGLPAGEYTVDAGKANYIAANFKLKVPAAPLLVRLVRYGVISGQVRYTEGTPVEGRVTAPGGRTIGSARIAVLVKQAGSEELRSVRQVALEEGGRYRIFDLPPGQYALGLWYAGLRVGSGVQLHPDNAHPRFFTVSGGEDYRDIDFLVAPGAAYSVSGKIDLPKPNTSFSLALSLPEQPAMPIALVVSELDGSFRFEKIPSGTYDLFVAGPQGGYGAFDNALAQGVDPLFGRTRVQVVGQNVEGVSVTLSAGISVDVTLRAQGSGPLPQGCPQSAAVTLQFLEPWGILANYTVQAGFAKAQSVRNLPPARYSVTASGLGIGCYQVNRPVVDLSGDTTNAVAVEVAPAGSIRGVLRAGSAPVKDFAVVLLDAEATDGTPAQLAFADEQGHFGFDGLRPGRYRIAAQPAAEASRARWVADVMHMVVIDVPGGVPTDLDLPVAVVKGGGR